MHTGDNTEDRWDFEYSACVTAICS